MQTAGERSSVERALGAPLGHRGPALRARQEQDRHPLAHPPQARSHGPTIRPRACAREACAAPLGSCMIGAVRLVSWNVAGRVRRQPEQAEVVAAVGADVVALQEVTARTLPLWRAALAGAGLPHVRCALDEPPEATGRRLLGVLTRRARAARAPPGARRTCRGRSGCCAAGRRRASR